MIKQYIDEIDGLTYVQPYENSEASYYAFIIKFDETKFVVNREEFVQALKCEGCVEFDIPHSTTLLSTLDLFKSPQHFFSSYNSGFIANDQKFENAENFDKSIIKLPVWYTDDDWLVVYKYCEALKKVSNAFRRTK